MGRSTTLLRFWLLLPYVSSLLFGRVHAANESYITAQAEYNTECKTCPHSLCTNKVAYEYEDVFNATCWTRGTAIVGDKYVSWYLISKVRTTKRKSN